MPINKDKQDTLYCWRNQIKSAFANEELLGYSAFTVSSIIKADALICLNLFLDCQFWRMPRYAENLIENVRFFLDHKDAERFFRDDEGKADAYRDIADACYIVWTVLLEHPGAFFKLSRLQTEFAKEADRLGFLKGSLLADYSYYEQFASFYALNLAHDDYVSPGKNIIVGYLGWGKMQEEYYMTRKIHCVSTVNWKARYEEIQKKNITFEIPQDEYSRVESLFEKYLDKWAFEEVDRTPDCCFK